MYREYRGSVPESERFDLKKIQLSSKLSPKEFAKKIREWMGTARRLIIYVFLSLVHIFCFFVAGPLDEDAE